jgi:hypothetical protein
MRKFGVFGRRLASACAVLGLGAVLLSGCAGDDGLNPNRWEILPSNTAGPTPPPPTPAP